jgi:drug/metabolite transporter (DMT)-like permease
MAWIFLNEVITLQDFIGLSVATIGVYIVTQIDDNDRNVGV